MSKKKKIVLDEYHYHEALDRTDMLLRIIEDHLREHPVVQKHKQLKIRVEIAEEILAEVHQHIGNLDYKIFSSDQVSDSK